MYCYENNESLNALESALKKIAEKLLEKDDRISIEEFVVRAIMGAMLRDDLDSAIEFLKSYRDINTTSES